jgi:hypothetical protein
MLIQAQVIEKYEIEFQPENQSLASCENSVMELIQSGKFQIYEMLTIRFAGIEQPEDEIRLLWH